MLSAEELAYLQDSTEGSFPDTVIVRRTAVATAADDEGNWVGGDQEDTTYFGRLVQRAASERIENVQQEVTSWSVLLPHDADVDAADQIIVGDQTFEVLGPVVYKPSPGQATHVRVELRYVGV